MWPNGSVIARERAGEFRMTTLGLALCSAAVLGFRHGFDHDHIAALSDIASVQNSPSHAMRLAPLYAFGHWSTIAVLGAAVIHFKLALPHSLDKLAERIVGTTLIALGAYVFITLSRRSSAGVPKTRMTLLVQAVRIGFWRAKQLFSPEALSKPQPSVWNYDQRSVFALGILHGLGAETPTQLALFALAANLGGAMKGFFGLVMFLAGLLAVNTLIMAAAAGIFGASTLKPWLLKSATAATAIYSLVVGTIFLLN